MTLAEFEQQVVYVAMASPVCGIPSLRRQTASPITLRIQVAPDAFIEAFHNDRTGTTAYALIRQGRRVFGADNTGGWHVHPLDNPEIHVPLGGAMSFSDFVAEIEKKIRSITAL